ncbi:hypothetical protein O0L34_g10240 [Tuta absoluta]|nr:hypothetical protein O0L34_g10240 [Tuta absoluta]
MFFNLETLNSIDNVLEINCQTVESLEGCRNILNQSHDLKVLTYNIRSIQRNFNTFLIALKRLDISFDVIVLTECWLLGGAVVGQIPGFTSYSTTRINNQNGGVVVYVNDKWDASVSEPLLSEAECLKVELTPSIAVLGIYRSPSFKKTDTFLNSLGVLLEPLGTKSTVILAGDININILDESEVQVSSYLCLMAEAGLRPAITRPTREDRCLDHIFIKSRSELQAGLVAVVDITDHLMAMAGLSCKQPTRKRPSRTVTKIDYPSVLLELKNTDWTSVISTADVNIATKEFTTILTEVIRKNSTEVRLRRSKFTLKPWITPGLIRCMKHRDRLHLDHRKNPKDDVKRVIYTRYRNFFNELLYSLKQNYENCKLEDSKDDPKTLWKTIDEISERPNRKNVATELAELIPGKPVESLNQCNKYFSTVGRELADHLLLKQNLTQASIVSEIAEKNPVAQSIFMCPTN